MYLCLNINYTSGNNGSRDLNFNDCLLFHWCIGIYTGIKMGLLRDCINLFMVKLPSNWTKK